MEELVDTSEQTDLQQLSFEEKFDQAKIIFEEIMQLQKSGDDSKVNSQEMPIFELKKLSEFIQMIVDDQDLLDNNEQFKEFFYNKFANGLLRVIASTKSSNDEYLNIIAVIVK